MIPEMTLKWQDFARRGFAILEAEANEPTLGSGARRRLRLGIYPTFEEPVTYQVIMVSLRGFERWFMTRRQWRADFDREKFRTPVEWAKHRGSANPTIETSIAQVGPEFASMVCEILATQIPPIPIVNPARILTMTDGVAYSAEWGLNPKIRLEYHHGLPPEWSELEKHFANLIRLAEAIENWVPLSLSAYQGQIGITILWQSERASMAEIQALRQAIPGFLERPIVELRDELAPHRFDLGPHGISDALSLKEKAQALGLQIELDPAIG